MTYLKTFLAIALAQALIYSGVCFLAGQLLPNVLKEFYAQSSSWIRVVIFTVVSAIPANILISWGFQATGATFGGVMNATCAVAAAVATAILVDGATLTAPAALAFIVMAASAAYGIVSLRGSVP